jgi:hypothetical protein
MLKEGRGEKMGAVVVGETRQITSFSVERRKAATEGIMRERERGRGEREKEKEGRKNG